MAGALIGAAIGAGTSLYGAHKASSAAKKAARQQQAGIERGITDSQPYYETAQNYLSPYVERGEQSSNLLNDIIGMNGPEAQSRALTMYQSNPSSSLLKNVLDDTARRTIGTFSASGNANSGRAVEELGRRMSDVQLGDYGNWTNLIQGGANTGANASLAAAELAGGRGNSILGARMDQGTVAASGTAGSATSWLKGLNGAANYLNYGIGRYGQQPNNGAAPTPTTSGNDFAGAFNNYTPYKNMGF